MKTAAERYRAYGVAILTVEFDWLDEGRDPETYWQETINEIEIPDLEHDITGAVVTGDEDSLQALLDESKGDAAAEIRAVMQRVQAINHRVHRASMYAECKLLERYPDMPDALLVVEMARQIRQAVEAGHEKAPVR